MSGNIEARLKGMLGEFSLNADFTCPSTGITGLFGPSGCGKTTILRCFAGLTHLKDGYLKVGDEIWQDTDRFLAPHKRPIAYVFQEARLFSHLSVLQNLRYGLVRSAEASRAIAIEPVVDLMGLGALLHRSPAALSGGEQQRVAIGRALLSQPRLLLMDEPLSALDRQSRNEILPYIETLHRSLSIPIIYVSHDLSEVERLADHLILMSRDGQVQASGPLAALLTDLSLPIARQPEAAAVLTIEVESHDAGYDMSVCRIGPLRLEMPGNFGIPGTMKRVRVHAKDVSIAKTQAQDTSVLNILPARIVAAEAIGASQVLVLLALLEGEHDARLLSSVTRKSWERLELGAGDSVFAQVKSMALAENS